MKHVANEGEIKQQVRTYHMEGNFGRGKTFPNLANDHKLPNLNNPNFIFEVIISKAQLANYILLATYLTD